MIRAGVNKLLDHRPADAMAFLAEYFQSQVAESPPAIMAPPKKWL